jgi:ABC-type transporter Mla subunit MlaD
MIDLELPDQPSTALIKPGAFLEAHEQLTLPDQAGRMGGQMLMEISTVLAPTRTLLDSLSRTVGAAHTMIASMGGDMPQLVTQMRAQLDATTELTNEVRSQIQAITPALAANLDSVAHLVGDSRGLVNNLSSSLDQHNPQIETILGNLESTTLMLDYVTREIARFPPRLFTGVKLPSTDSLRKMNIGHK